MSEGDFIRKQIRRAREEKNLSQRQMAKIMETTQATISDIERGRVQINATDLARYAKCLEKPIAYFYPADLETNTTLEAELLNLFRSVPERWQQRILDNARIQARLRKRIQPYEQAGIPEEFYDFLLWEELDTMGFEEITEIPDFASERLLQQRYLEWRKKIDQQKSDQERENNLQSNQNQDGITRS